MPPVIPKNYRDVKRQSTRKKVLETMNEFSESTTIHGFAYAANKEHSPWRPAWGMVLVAAAIFTSFQVYSLYDEWQVNPVITTLKTVAQPIDEIEFPAVTICPQGSRQEILESVLFRQFKEYISSTSEQQSEVTPEQMLKQVQEFLDKILDCLIYL